MSDFLDIFALDNANLRYVILGAVIIGATGGLLGSFAVLRKRSLLGDALAHASLPGVAIAFLMTGSKSLLVLLTGATISGIFGVLAIQWIVNNTQLKSDAALGIVLSVFFGLGIVILTYIQHGSYGNQSGLEKFLFGQAAAIIREDIIIMSIAGVIIFSLVIVFYKELRGMIFDYNYMQSMGFRSSRIDLMLMGLITLTVMIGLQAVGVILMAAMLITPAVASRFWSNRFQIIILISVFFGILSGLGGTLISAAVPRIPTGPVMVLFATLLFIISAVFAPQKGLLAIWHRKRNNRNREFTQHILRAFWELQEKNPDSAIFSIVDLQEQIGIETKIAKHRLLRILRQGYINTKEGKYQLTEKGSGEAEFVVKSHRLWEHYLRLRTNLDTDHVDRPADEVEHILTPKIIAQIESILLTEDPLHKPVHDDSHGYREGGKDNV